VADFELKALITGVDKLSPELKKMQKSIKKFREQTGDVAVKALAMGAALTTAFALPVSKAMAFESTMADIRKVVDFDNAKQFADMGEAVLKLSTQLPMAADGIGQIVAAGGQAGIARKELMGFATDAVKMGIAFDQTAEESGQMMATWRTAFRMTQGEVVTLADKINFLGNTGPASSKKISDVVTRVGSIGKTAGLNSGEVAALGATITGVGVQSEVASTGIKNLTKALTAGKAMTKDQAAGFKVLGFDNTQLAKDMQKDAKGTIVKVLDSIRKLPEYKQQAATLKLFGSESAEAIMPLLTNLSLLKTNFDRVSNAQEYAGSMQKEYASRAETTQNAVQLLRNQFDAASITIGSIFLPYIVQLTKKVQPVLEQFRQYIRANPDIVKKTFAFGTTLLGVGVAFGAVSRAARILEGVMKMSTLGKVISLLTLGAALVINNWDDVGPVIKSTWTELDKIVQTMGGWETMITNISTIMGGVFVINTVGSLRAALTTAQSLSGVLGKISSLGAMTVSIGIALSMFKQLDDLEKQASESGKNKGEFLVGKLREKEHARGYYGFMPRLRELLGMDDGIPQGRYTPSVSLNRGQPAELKVSFENAPPGMKVNDAGSALPWLNYDVGYTTLSKPNG
jgi:TP901 family phage tail tape measure protein